MKKRLLGFLSVALILIAFMLAIESPGGYCIGDQILNTIGLRPWSYAYLHGVHYAFILTVTLILIGCWGVNSFLEGTTIKRNLIVVIILFALIAKPTFLFCYHLVLSRLPDIDAIEYDAPTSTCIARLSPNSNLTSYSYKISLVNYSDKAVVFNMRVQIPLKTHSNMVVVKEKQNNEFKTFVIMPKQKKVYYFTLTALSDKKYKSEFRKPNIILFKKDKCKVFNVSPYCFVSY